MNNYIDTSYIRLARRIMSDNTNNESSSINANIYLLLRVLILISTVVLIYFAIEDRFRENIPITVVVLAILIFLERWASKYQCKDKDNVEGFDRTSRLERLNAGRGKLGQFYVNCKGCGRKKILQERVKSLFDQPPCGRYQTVGPCEGCSSCDHQEGCNGCTGCDNPGRSNPHSNEHIFYKDHDCPDCRGAGLHDGRKCESCGGCGGCGKCQRCLRRARYRARRFYKPEHHHGEHCGCGGNCDGNCGEKRHHGVDTGCTKCNSGNNIQGSNRSYCIKDCADNIGRDTVSLWNDDYIDTNEIFCYNCALDLGAKVENRALALRELPAINGPPGYSVYRDMGYSY
jgi:hypothetical protein